MKKCFNYWKKEIEKIKDGDQNKLLETYLSIQGQYFLYHLTKEEFCELVKELKKRGLIL